MARKLKVEAQLEPSLEDLAHIEINPKLEESVMAQLQLVEGLPEYLRQTMAADMQRHFGAETPQHQFVAKGAYYRTKYFLKRVLDARERKALPEKKTKKKKADIAGRYA